MSEKIVLMIVVGYPCVSSSLAGRVSPAIAKSRLETDPPDAVTVPVMVVGVVPDPPLELAPEPEPEPGREPPVELDEQTTPPPALQSLGAVWHLLEVTSQYHPP